MDEDNVLTAFLAKLKTITAKGGEVSTLDFVVEAASMGLVAPLLKLIDAAFELSVGNVLLASKVGYLKFNGDGRVYVRLLADTKDTISQLQSQIDREVTVEVRAK